MGFDDLVLVAPRWPNVLHREIAIQRASGATDVLTRARVVATLDEALDGLHHLCATADGHDAARLRAADAFTSRALFVAP